MEMVSIYPLYDQELRHYRADGVQKYIDKGSSWNAAVCLSVLFLDKEEEMFEDEEDLL